jgi:phage shock protein A
VFKLMLTLLRGTANAAATSVAQNNALVILDQQIRDAGAAIGSARRALAIAMAEDRRETQRAEALSGQIAGLEDRVRAALAGNREDLATLAAGAIAEMEMNRDAAARASALFGAEIARLRRTVDDAERRFAELHRGRRLACVGEAVSRSRLGGITPAILNDAEATLTDLRTRQQTLADAEEAMDEISPAPACIAHRLSQAGFGPPTHPTAASVLARLRPPAIAQS